MPTHKHDRHAHHNEHRPEPERALKTAAYAEEAALHGHDERLEKMEHEHGDHRGHEGHASHHAHMVADFRRRFWISLVLSIPVIVLAPMIQEFLGLRDVLRFPGDAYVQFAFATVIFFYGGWPFLRGLYDELRVFGPGMMTLIALAITVAYTYSTAVVFGLAGEVFFWELVTLIDVMLLGQDGRL